MSQIILIADKSITIQKIVELTFQEEDFEVVPASNGKEALDKIEQYYPSIVLADISLPEINGYELCRMLRKEARYAKFSKVPVLLLAGIYETMDEQKAKFVEEKSREVESNGVLSKPFDPQELIQKVKQMALPPTEVKEKLKEVEEVFQVEEEHKEVLKEEEIIKGDLTVGLSDEEKRYIMGMAADKELSPELTGDIFEEHKEESIEFLEEGVEPKPAKEEDLFLEEEIEKEAEIISEASPIEEISAEQMPESKPEASMPIDEFIEGAESKEESPLFIEEEPPLIIEEPEVKAAVIPEEEDILGISEFEEKEEEMVIEEAKEVVPEQEAPATSTEKEAILEIKESLEEVSSPLEEIIGETLEAEEASMKIEEVIPEKEEEPLLIEEPKSEHEAEKEIIQEKIDEIVESQLEKGEAPFVEPMEKAEIIEKKEIKAERPLEEMLLSDELIDKIVEKVVNKISTKTLEEIAWQVVPDLAEKIIKSIVEKLKLKE